ncbi:MAG: hypothetical protein AAGJ10_03035 [Bacteroidota bacterium]
MTDVNLLALAEKAFEFLCEKHDFEQPILEFDSRDQYDYVLFEKGTLTIVVVYWPPLLPHVVITQEGVSPVGLPYSESLTVEPRSAYPIYQKASRVLTGWWVRWRQKAELEQEVEQCLRDLAGQVEQDYDELLETLQKSAT